MWCDLLPLLPPPHNTNNTCKLHMCSMLHAPRGWQSTCLCMCTKFAYKFLGGSCRGHSWIKMRIHSKLMSLLRFAPPRPTCPTRTLARSLCKQELKLLVCNTHPQAFAMWRKINVKCCAFSSQMQTNDLPPCGAHVWGYAPIKFSAFKDHLPTYDPHLPNICFLHINIHVIYMFFYML